LRLQKIGAMEILAPYLGGRRREYRSLELSYRALRHSQVALDHSLMPGQLTLIDPPCPCGVFIAHPLMVEGLDLGKQAKSAVVSALRQRACLPREEQGLKPRGQPVVSFKHRTGDLERFLWPSLGRGVHARVLECQKLNGFIACEAGEIQRFLIHPASEVVRLGVVCQPADDFG